MGALVITLQIAGNIFLSGETEVQLLLPSKPMRRGQIPIQPCIILIIFKI